MKRSRQLAAPAVMGAAASSATATFPGTTAPNAPAKGPSQDVAYLSHAFEALTPISLSSWDVMRIRAARDEHALGVFASSALLADAMLTDARIAGGLMQRLGPLLGIPRLIEGGPRWNGKGLTETARFEAEQMFAPEASACPPGTLAAGFVATCMMGFTIVQNVWHPRKDGSRIDIEARPWPLQLCNWNEALRRYQLSTTEGLVTVEPNDGKWIVIEPRGPRSFLFGALRALALVWADRAYAQRDRSNHSAAHGSMSIVGTLPAGIATESPEGQAFRKAIQMLQRARSGLVKTFGTTVDTFEPKTLAWQIFGQIVNSTNSDIMLELTGIAEGSVYKPISQLDGVRYGLVRDELGAAAAAYNEGFLKPWALLNFGDEDAVPRFSWAIPDPREQERLDALGRRYAAFNETISGLTKSGFDVTQDVADRIAARFGVEAPKLKPMKAVPAQATGDTPAPTEQQEDASIARAAESTS